MPIFAFRLLPSALCLLALALRAYGQDQNVNGSVNISRTSADGTTLLNINGGASTTGYRIVAQNNGTNVFRVEPTGNLLLDVMGGSDGAFVVNNAGTGPAAIFNGGNVGVGTTGPAALLDVNVGSSKQAYFGTSGSANARTTIDAIGGGRVFQTNLAGVLTNLIQTDGVSYLNGGNVGIGTTTPTNRLTVSAGVNDGILISANNPTLLFNHLGAATNYARIVANSGASVNYNGLWLASNEKSDGTQGNPSFSTWAIDLGGSDMTLNDSFNIRRKPAGGAYSIPFAITSAGAVGLGITNPSDRLVVRGWNSNSGTEFGNTAGGVNYLQSYDRVATAYKPFQIQAAGATPNLYLDTTGNVGVGTTSPAAKLDVAGSANVSGSLTAGSMTATTINIPTSGNAVYENSPGAGNAVFFDNSLVGSTIRFRTSNAAADDTTALTLSPSGGATIAGNISVNGTGTSNLAGSVNVGGSVITGGYLQVGQSQNTGAFLVEPIDANNNVRIGARRTGVGNPAGLQIVTSTAGNVYNPAATFDSSQNTTLAGNLTVAGTGTSTFAGPISSTSGATSSFVGDGTFTNGILGIGGNTGTNARNWISGNANQLLLWPSRYYATTQRAEATGAYSGKLEYDATTGGWTLGGTTTTQTAGAPIANDLSFQSWDRNGNSAIAGNLTVGGTFSAANYTATSGTVSGGSSGLTLNAGGTNQNLTLSPSGSGNTIINGKVGVGTSTPAVALDVNGDIGSAGVVSAEGGKHIVSSPWVTQTGSFTGYVKLVTPIQDHESNMFTIRITGYRYSSGADTFTISASGYAYSNGGLLSTRCRTDGTDLPVEMGTETRNGVNVVVVRIGTPTTSWYYPNWSFEYRGWQPKKASDFAWTIGETTPAQTGNTNNVVIRNDAGPSTFNAGNVGIGNTAPLTKLHVTESVGSNFAETISNDGSTGANNYLQLKTSTALIGSLYRPAASNAIRLAGYDSVTLSANENGGNGGSIQLLGGKVGVGTSTPNQQLEIGGNGGIGFSGGSPILNSADKTLYSPTDGALEWYTNNAAGAHAFRISNQGNVLVSLDSNGNTYFNGGGVGIGTKTPDHPLTVRSFSDGADAINWIDSAGTLGALGVSGTHSGWIGLQSSGTTEVEIRAGGSTYFNGGNVGVGTSSPAAMLEVAGDTKVDGNLTVAGTFSAPGYVANNGTITGGTSGLALSAGGTNQNITITPSGTGATVIGGNVGIGTTNPGAKLNVEGTTASIRADVASGQTGGLSVFEAMSDNGQSVLQMGVFGTAKTGTTFGASNANLAYLYTTTYNTTCPTGLAIGTYGAQPLYFGTNGVERMRIDQNGNVGIGTTSPDTAFTVKGRIHATEVVVDTTVAAADLKVQPKAWADDVFDSDHKLAPLSEVERDIKKDKHLPGIPSAADVAANGVSVSEMQTKLLAQVEELTLRMIQQEKRIEKLESENSALRDQLQKNLVR